IYTQYENPQTTILFNQSEIEIHLTARGRTEAEAGALLDHLSEKLEERLGNAVFSFAGEKMEEVVGLKLTVGGYTLSVAESCTGGLIAQRLTEVPGSSKYFIEGVVAYSNDAKTRTLGVEPVLLLEHGAV
ncbi:MAG: CinA family protein, partial [Pyrinomonadaceae bacterium]